MNTRRGRAREKKGEQGRGRKGSREEREGEERRNIYQMIHCSTSHIFRPFLKSEAERHAYIKRHGYVELNMSDPVVKDSYCSRSGGKKGGS